MKYETRCKRGKRRGIIRGKGAVRPLPSVAGREYEDDKAQATTDVDNGTVLRRDRQTDGTRSESALGPGFKTR